jgi:hypothetical protein
MEEFAERPNLRTFNQKRKQFMEDRLDGLSQWGVYSLVASGIDAGVAVVWPLASGQDPRSSDPIYLLMGLVFVAAAICALVALGNGALAVWAWSTIAFKSGLGSEAYPFQRYWHRPYGPRVALIVIVIVASIPAVYFRFHNPPLSLGCSC